MAEHTNSVLISLSALNMHQNRELNPNALEYIPVLFHPNHHANANATANPTTSPATFYYSHHYPTLVPYTLMISTTHPPPPPQPHTGFYYFQPIVPPQFPHAHFARFIPQVQPQQQLTWGQTGVDQVHVLESERMRNNSRRCGGRLRRRGAASGSGGVWRVKGSGRRSSDEPNRDNYLEYDRNRANRVRLTSSANVSQEHNEDEDSSEWRMVKYRAGRKLGRKCEIQPVDKSVKKTTIMIRNIPSRYTEMMLSFLDRHCMEVNQMLSPSEEFCRSSYDFFYMPMDFKTGLNKSYAFVNFTTPEGVWRFHAKCDTQKWELFESNKIRQIALAKLQGTGELIEHFGKTAFACNCDEFLPVYFEPPRDGRADVERVTSIIGKRVG